MASQLHVMGGCLGRLVLLYSSCDFFPWKRASRWTHGSWSPPPPQYTQKAKRRNTAGPWKLPGQDGLVAQGITRGVSTQNDLSCKLLDDTWPNTIALLSFLHPEGPDLRLVAKRHSSPFLLNGKTLNSLYILEFRSHQNGITLAWNLFVWMTPYLTHRTQHHTHIHN